MDSVTLARKDFLIIWIYQKNLNIVVYFHFCILFHEESRPFALWFMIGGIHSTSLDKSWATLNFITLTTTTTRTTTSSTTTTATTSTTTTAKANTTLYYTNDITLHYSTPHYTSLTYTNYNYNYNYNCNYNYNYNYNYITLH